MSSIAHVFAFLNYAITSNGGLPASTESIIIKKGQFEILVSDRESLLLWHSLLTTKGVPSDIDWTVTNTSQWR